MPKEKYDPSSFVIPAKDTRGESARVWCRLQPGHDRQLDVIVGAHRFPFKTKGDIIRWCINQGIKRLEQMEDIPSNSRRVEIIMEIVRAEQEMFQFKQVFEAVGVTIAQHESEGDHQEATRLAARIKSEIDKMEDDHWKKKWLKQFDARFGHLLEVGSRRKASAGAEEKVTGPVAVVRRGAKLRVAGGQDEEE